MQRGPGLHEAGLSGDQDWWQGRDSNPRHKAYEASALPLSYPASMAIKAGVARSVGLEPTTSASAGLRSIQTELRAHVWCRRGDLNPHARYGHCALNAARLPFRHFGSVVVGGAGFEPATSCV